MKVEELSGVDAQVYRAVAELEGAASAPHATDVAGHVGLGLDETRAALGRLVNAHPGLLHEVPDSTGAAADPVYELAPRT